MREMIPQQTKLLVLEVNPARVGKTGLFQANVGRGRLIHINGNNNSLGSTIHFSQESMCSRQRTSNGTRFGVQTLLQEAFSCCAKPAKNYNFEAQSHLHFHSFLSMFGGFSHFKKALHRQNMHTLLSDRERNNEELVAQVRPFINYKIEGISTPDLSDDNIVRVFFDTEFNDETLGQGEIELISIGASTGFERAYYAVSNEFNLQAAEAHPFLPKHVLPTLGEEKDRIPAQDIKTSFLEYLAQSRTESESEKPKLQIWTRMGFADITLLHYLYDGKDNFESLMQHYGFSGVEYADFHDIRPLMPEGYHSLRQEEGKHNAAADARHLGKSITHMMKALRL